MPTPVIIQNASVALNATGVATIEVTLPAPVVAGRLGDDTWQPHLINKVYGSTFPAPTPSRPGKNVGWADWTHGG
jgi:hypothetical protein